MSTARKVMAYGPFHHNTKYSPVLLSSEGFISTFARHVTYCSHFYFSFALRDLNMPHFDLFRFSRIHQFYIVKYFTLTLSKDLDKKKILRMQWQPRETNFYYNFVVKGIHLIMDDDTSDMRNRAVPIMDVSFQPLNGAEAKNPTYFKTVSSCSSTKFTWKNALVSDSLLHIYLKALSTSTGGFNC